MDIWRTVRESGGQAMIDHRNSRRIPQRAGPHTRFIADSMKPQPPGAGYTGSACFPCRHSKRRCDKALPACQLCIRKGVECWGEEVADRLSLQTAKPHDTLKTSAAFNLRMGVFARLAQSTYLVNQALKFLASLPPQGEENDSIDIGKYTTQLRRTIWALIYVTKKEFTAKDLATCCQTAISYWHVRVYLGELV
ncbi:hypothetical protein J3F83DRAFT_728478 [Trichoderma novae-zelandiae]